MEGPAVSAAGLRVRWLNFSQKITYFNPSVQAVSLTKNPGFCRVFKMISGNIHGLVEFNYQRDTHKTSQRAIQRTARGLKNDKKGR